MIVTVTANPSLDRTLELGAPLARGEVQRAGVVRTEPGGKPPKTCSKMSNGSW